MKKDRQEKLPAAQDEMEQKLQQLQSMAHHVEAYEHVRVVVKGMQLQTLRRITEDSEALEKSGFNRLEDHFESLGISARTGFNLKKIAAAFSDEEVQLLQSAGFSQRRILRLAALPPGELAEIKDTDDIEELKVRLEDALAGAEKQKEAARAAASAAETYRQKVKLLEKRLPAPDRRDEYARARLRQIESLIGNLHAHLDEFANDAQVVWSDKVKSTFIAFAQQAQMRIEMFYIKHGQRLGLKFRPAIEPATEGEDNQ